MRAAAVDALIAIVKGRKESSRAEVIRSVRGLLADPDLTVRHRAIAAAAELEDREAIPGTARRGRDARFAVRGRPRPGRPARSPRLAGLPPRPDREEHRAAPRLGHGHRQPARPGGPGARSARPPPRAGPRTRARAPHHLRRAQADHRMARGRALPDRRVARHRREQAHRSQSQLRRGRWASCDLAVRQAGRSQGPARPRPHLQPQTTTWPPTATPRFRARPTGRRRWPWAPTTR